MSTGKVPVPDVQRLVPESQWTHEEYRQALEELELFKAAQKAVDSVMGEGTYVRINGFDPSKGETHKWNN